MGVYRRTDAATYWMSLVIEGKRLRQDTGVQNRRVAGEIFAAWQVQVARDRWLGMPAATPTHTVQELVTEYLATVTPRKSPASQRGDHVVLEEFRKRWGVLGLDQLRTKTLEDYLAARLHNVTLATVSKELGVLKSAYGRAMRWDWVTTTLGQPANARRVLPAPRNHFTQKAKIAGQRTLYLSVPDDEYPSEIFPRQNVGSLIKSPAERLTQDPQDDLSPSNIEEEA